MLPPSARTMGEAGDENLSASLLGADAGSPPTTRFGSLQGKIRGGLGYLRSYLPDGSSGAGANGYAYSEADLLASEEVRKRHFLSHLCIKCIILPRQARDKHRKNSKKSAVFSQDAEHLPD
jgi:hypothetical protein